MINAKEANKKTKENLDSLSKNVYINVENKINESIDSCFYSCYYHFYAKEKAFMECVYDLLTKLGYHIDIKGDGYEISWDK